MRLSGGAGVEIAAVRTPRIHSTAKIRGSYGAARVMVDKVGGDVVHLRADKEKCRVFDNTFKPYIV